MSTIREENERKRELLDRYRSMRLEEILTELRERAREEAARDRFPWKGAFRSRAEIEALYREKRRWDRRLLFDTLLLCILFGLILWQAPRLIAVFLPS